MKTVIALLIYFIIVLIFSNSKLKPCWIIWIAFMAGYYMDHITESLIKWFS